MAQDTEPALTVDVLGPVRATVDGEPVELNRAQVRRLLAMVAARPGAILTTDDAIEGLWPEEHPADPRAALRVVLSRLRSALGDAADLLTSATDGIRLEPQRSDIVEFTELVDRARQATDDESAASLLDEALGLWRDRPFVDTQGPALLEDVARSLEETRWFARGRLVEALLELDEHDRVVEQATPWAANEPHRERLAIDLARSLAATGRKSTALETLSATRDYLRDQFGVDPSTALLDAEHEILTGAVQLADRPGTAGGPESPTPRAAIGRDGEVERLLTGSGTTVVIGEPGIGKSTLLDAFVDQSAAAGVTVLRTAVEEAIRRPLEPIAKLLQPTTRESSASVPPALARRLFPQRSDGTDGDPVPDAVGTTVMTRESLVRACADLVAELAPAATTTIVIDDGHWLDGLSAEVLATVHTSGRTRLVVGTRPVGPIETTLDGAEVLDLAPLSTDDLVDLLTREVPRLANHETAEDLHQRSGGNPFFAQLLIDILADGTSPVDRLPSSVLVAVQQRIDDLRRQTVRALEVACVLGTSFPVDHFTALRPADREALDEAVDAHLLRFGGEGSPVDLERDESTDSLVDGLTAAFVHALVAEGVYDLTSPARRIDLHDEVGRFLESIGAGATAYADHFEAAAEIDPSRAVRSLLAAGAIFADAFTWDVARSLFDRALAVHAEQQLADDRISAEVLVRLGGVLRMTADPTSGEVLLEGARLAGALGEDELFARAVIELCSHGRTLAAGMVDDRAWELLSAALELELPVRLRAELCATATTLLSMSDQHELSRRLYLEAFDAARDLEDPELDVAVFMSAHLGLSHPDDFDLRAVAADRLAALGHDDTEIGWEAHFLHFSNALVTGDGPRMWSSLEAVRELTPLVVARPRWFGLAFCEVAAALIDEDYEEAERHLETALEEGLSRYPENWVMGVYSSLLLGIRRAEGRVDELGPTVEGLIDEAPDFPTWRVAAVIAAIDSDDLVAARRHWAQLRAVGFDQLITDQTWTAAMGFVGRSAVILDDDETAEFAYESLLPHSGRMCWAGTCTYGPVDEVLALVADKLGHHDEAEAHRRAAEELVRGLRQRD